MIPEFDEHGNLPPGVHRATWGEVVTRYATSTHRRDLLEGLLDALRSLRAAGCTTAYLDGSFVTAKVKPGDFDVCWEPEGVVFDRLDPELRNMERAAQKVRYGGELYPADWPADPDGRTILRYFQRDTLTKQPKGIVAIDLGGLP